jgi:hypothetical protein
MINPLKIPSENLEDFFDVNEFATNTALKLNEVIAEINALEESTFEDELYALIETWKKEASELEDHPDMFPGFSPEICTAIARSKRHCCTEILKLIGEYTK